MWPLLHAELRTGGGRCKDVKKWSDRGKNEYYISIRLTHSVFGVIYIVESSLLTVCSG